VDAPRILALQAEPPQAEPGQAVSLQGLVASPDPEPSDLSLLWSLCPHPSLEECARAEDLVPVGSGPTATTSIPPDAFPGTSTFYWVDLMKGGERRERALKEVPIRAPGFPGNNNPRIDSLLVGGASLIDGSFVMGLEEEIPVWVQPEGMPAEIYDASGRRVSEEIRLATYTSGGRLVDPSGTGSSGALRYESAGEPGLHGLWIVMQDDRGGVDWVEAWVDVQEER
jgi:hypothetical protein